MEKEKIERQKDALHKPTTHLSEEGPDSVGKRQGPLDQPVQARAVLHYPLVRPLEGYLSEQLLLRSNEHSNEMLQSAALAHMDRAALQHLVPR